MPQQSRTFRIFVSSTFSDLKAERNALQLQVFPKLRELCQRHGCRFQAIDLRLPALLREATVGMAVDRRLKFTASATEQEIVQGALGVTEAAQHVFGFFRTIGNLPRDVTARDFLDLGETGALDEEAHTRLGKLKERLRSLLPGHIHDYEAGWRGPEPTTDHLGTLPDTLKECLRLTKATDAPATLRAD